MTTLETVTLVTTIVGAATGIIGMVLGIITVCDQLAKNRVRLRGAKGDILLFDAKLGAFGFRRFGVHPIDNRKSAIARPIPHSPLTFPRDRPITPSPPRARHVL